MIDKEVIRHFTMEYYPSGQLNDHDKILGNFSNAKITI